jgi:hypothetical protein
MIKSFTAESSEAIQGATYCNGVITVAFRQSSKVYSYKGGHLMFCNWMRAKSKGVFFNKYLQSLPSISA